MPNITEKLISVLPDKPSKLSSILDPATCGFPATLAQPSLASYTADTTTPRAQPTLLTELNLTLPTDLEPSKDSGLLKTSISED